MQKGAMNNGTSHPFADALKIVARVMRDGAATHPDSEWLQRPAESRIRWAEELLRLWRNGGQQQDHTSHGATPLLMALDTVESGQPPLLPGTPALSARNARASRRALDETAQGRSTRQDREASRQERRGGSSSRSASLRLQIGHKCAGGGQAAFETTQPSASAPILGQNRERGARTLGSQLEWGHKKKFRIKRNRGAAASRPVRHRSV
jgi:hypothetical protein